MVIYVGFGGIWPSAASADVCGVCGWQNVILGVPTSETEGGEVEGGEVAALAGARVGQKLYMPSRRFWLAKELPWYTVLYYRSTLYCIGLQGVRV